MRTFLFIYEPLTSKMLVTIELLTYPLNDPETTTSLVLSLKTDISYLPDHDFTFSLEKPFRCFSLAAVSHGILPLVYGWPRSRPVTKLHDLSSLKVQTINNFACSWLLPHGLSKKTMSRMSKTLRVLRRLTNFVTLVVYSIEVDLMLHPMSKVKGNFRKEILE